MKIKLIKKYHEQANITYPYNIYYFWAENDADPKLNTIVECLVLEIKDGSWVKDFLSCPDWHATGEIIGIHKEKDNIILDDERHDYNEDHEDLVIIDKDKFLNILDQWKEVYFKKPDEIIIEQDEN